MQFVTHQTEYVQSTRCWLWFSRYFLGMCIPNINESKLQPKIFCLVTSLLNLIFAEIFTTGMYWTIQFWLLWWHLVICLKIVRGKGVESGDNDFKKKTDRDIYQRAKVYMQTSPRNKTATKSLSFQWGISIVGICFCGSAYFMGWGLNWHAMGN